jgi:hypothetical protein
MFLCNVRKIKVQSLSRTPSVQLHSTATIKTRFRPRLSPPVLCTASLPYSSIAMDIRTCISNCKKIRTTTSYNVQTITCISNCKKIRTTTSYNVQTILMNSKLLENVQLLPMKLHTCLMQFKLHKHARLVPQKLRKPLVNSCATTLWASENKMGNTSYSRHPLLIIVAGHQYNSLGSYYSIFHCITKTEWSSVTK